jgi:hypothetical protein
MKRLILDKQTLIDIANAVRNKTGSDDLVAIEDLDDAVAAIPSSGPSYEEYDGSWEVAGGYIVTFAETYAGAYDCVSFFSLDNGLTWDNANRFAYNKLEMEDVVQIKFKVTYEYIPGYEVYAGGRIVCEELGVDIEATSSNSEIITDNFILTQNINVSMGSAS